MPTLTPPSTAAVSFLDPTLDHASHGCHVSLVSIWETFFLFVFMTLTLLRHTGQKCTHRCVLTVRLGYALWQEYHGDAELACILHCSDLYWLFLCNYPMRRHF